MHEWFVISDLHEFTDKARAIVYNNFGLLTDNTKNNINILIDDIVESERDDFDRVLSHQESLVIVKHTVKKQKSKKNNSIRYILNEQLFAKIVEDLNTRMVSNIINNLVKKGLIESAFDTESNDFIFWVKDSETEKPETN